MLRSNDIIEFHNRTKFSDLSFARRHTRDYLHYCLATREFNHVYRRIALPDAWGLSTELPENKSAPLNHENLLKFMSLALGRRTLNTDMEGRLRRVFASAGNFQPLESYLVTNCFSMTATLEVTHLRSSEAELEVIQQTSSTSKVPQATLILTTLPHKAQTKYGYRGWRFSQIDLGHALACVHKATEALGWQWQHDKSVNQNDLAHLLGIEHIYTGEPELPAIVIQLQGEQQNTALDLKALIANNNLIANSTSAIGPKIAPDILTTTLSYFSSEETLNAFETDTSSSSTSHRSFKIDAKLLAERRSHRHFADLQSIKKETFFAFLNTMTENTQPLHHTRLKVSPYVQMAFYARHIDGLTPGLYINVREPEFLPLLKLNTHLNFLWQKVHNDKNQNLYLLKEIPTQLWPSLAVGGSFTENYSILLFNLGLFDKAIQSHGATAYPQMLWESGYIGQWAYWSAQMHGLKACGVGGYIDDVINVKQLGCSNFCLQTLGAYSIGA